MGHKTLLLGLLLLLAAPAHSFFRMPRMFLSGRQRRARNIAKAWAPVREQCEASPPCAALAEGTEDDCVLRCVSPRCWLAVYSADPLEPGQIDKARANHYESCLRASEAALEAAGLWPPRMSGLTNALQEEAEMEFNYFEAVAAGGGAPAGGAGGGGASGEGADLKEEPDL